ncbi:MAG: PepSY domain-containing protein [Paracoccaceae bacterium]
MLRRLHSVPGLIFGLILMVMASSGAVLSVDPGLERVSAPALPAISVADLAATVTGRFASVERIDHRANGAVVVSFEAADGFVSIQIDPVTGEELAAFEPSPFMVWIKSLHRSFLADDTGRAVAGISAGVMVLMAFSGLYLLTAALGGWRRMTRPLRGGAVQRWHGKIGRLAVAGLVLLAMTGVWMSLATFGFFDDGTSDSPDFPFEVSGGPPAPIAKLAALKDVPLADLRRLTFPVAGDPTDVYGLQTNTGEGYVDQSTGALLNWMPDSTIRQVSEFIYMLHTGQGLWWFGLLMGLGAVMVPVLFVTGTLIWWNRRQSRPRIAGMARAAQADLVILVGSEGGTTWGFAATAATALIAAGRLVHVAPMNALQDYPAAKAMIVMAATYGDGVAPASASGFVDRLAALKAAPIPVAVLGFGDRMFAQYCGYADTVAAGFAAKGWPDLMPRCRIDRQSPVDFSAWGRDLGAALGVTLELDHRIAEPATVTLALLSRQDFGAEVQAPAAILRFGPVVASGRFARLFAPRLPRFEAGDLVAVYPPGSDLPRFYSLASSRRDGFLEIAVRKMPGGVCSSHLHALEPGARIRVAIRPNPVFRPQSGRAPVIMVAAGCGIGPMAGFLRQMRPGRETTLYFGARDPASDYLYQADLQQWQAEGRLTRLVTAFSRVRARAYVQDRLQADAVRLRDQISRGGQVLVCGGSAMAHAVAAEIDVAIAPLGLTIAKMKAEGRYLEDVY